MKKSCVALALAGMFLVSKSPAISLDDIQVWTGSGTNRAALVVQWNPPIVLNQTTSATPIANKTMVWGYRFNGTATGTQMFHAIVAADPRLYVVENIDPFFGTGVEAIGFNLDGSGIAGVTDGTVTDGGSAFTNGVLTDTNLNVDGASSVNRGDLFWSGHYGAYWQLWNELNDSGGFTNSPNRGTSPYMDPNTYTQGEWASAYNGLDDLPLTDGSWIGFSVSADGYPTNTSDPNYAANLNVFNNDEQAPPSPDGTYVAYVCNTNDFAVQIISTNGVDAASPYNDPIALLNGPALRFFNPFGGGVTDRVSIIDPPFNVAPGGRDLITKIDTGGQVTVKLGRKIYDDPNNPYGADFIVYGYAFFSASHISSAVSDKTDLNSATLSTGFSSHPAIVSVSPDGVNWYTYGTTPALFPEEAYRWDDTNDSWTDEQMNPTKPLNPVIYTNSFGGQSVANGLDQFIGAAGGTSYDLKQSGFPWIQYIRVQPGAGTYTVIDAIAAVNPVVVGDALSITPDNLAAGITNLAFQKPDDCSQTLISLNFDSVSAPAKINTVSLNDFSSFAPVEGTVSSAYQARVKPVLGTVAVAYSAHLGLRVGDGYTGNGSDLRVFQWNCTNWISQPFTYNSGGNEILVAGVTNLSAFVVSQIVPPHLAIQSLTNGFAFQFIPVPNCPETLQCSTNLLTWKSVCSFTATNAQPMTLWHTNALSDKAFYRIQLNP